MPEYVDTVIIRIKGQDLDDVVLEFSEDREIAEKPVNTLNKAKEAKGVKRGNRMHTGTMKVEETDTGPDWDAMWESGEKFEMVKKPNVGKKINFSSVTISKISDGYSPGDSTRTITWRALRRRRS